MEKSLRVMAIKVPQNKNRRSNNKFDPPIPTSIKHNAHHLLRKSNKFKSSSSRQLYRIQLELPNVHQINSLNSSITTTRLARVALMPPLQRPRLPSLSLCLPKKRWTNIFNRIHQLRKWESAEIKILEWEEVLLDHCCKAEVKNNRWLSQLMSLALEQRDLRMGNPRGPTSPRIRHLICR